MDELQVLAQFPALAGLAVALLWNKAQKAEIDRMQERLDRMQERQNSLTDTLLKKTDLSE